MEGLGTAGTLGARPTCIPVTRPARDDRSQPRTKRRLHPGILDADLAMAISAAIAYPLGRVDLPKQTRPDSRVDTIVAIFRLSPVSFSFLAGVVVSVATNLYTS